MKDTKMGNTQTIFFDESGYTGNDLFNDDQPIFVYASVAIKPSQATELVTEMVNRFQLKGSELKGSNLVNRPRGQEAIYWLMERCKNDASIVVANKKYALAGKFYEYIFEPVLQADNSLFYAIGLHKFIATFLYVSLIAQNSNVENILREFQNFMRSQDPEVFQRLFPQKDILIPVNDPISQIQTFTLCHKDRIMDETNNTGEIGDIRNWVLELSTTCLFWTLSYWSDRFTKLRVYCDESKPVRDSSATFDSMIGREDIIYMKLGTDQERRLTFNLEGPIEFLDSKESHGIQIADVLSSSISYAYNHPDEQFSERCVNLAETMLSPLSILPDPTDIDLKQKRPFINAVILNELVDRSVRNESMYDGMSEYIRSTYEFYEISPPILDNKSEIDINKTKSWFRKR